MRPIRFAIFMALLLATPLLHAATAMDVEPKSGNVTPHPHPRQGYGAIQTLHEQFTFPVDTRLTTFTPFVTACDDKGIDAATQDRLLSLGMRYRLEAQAMALGGQLPRPLTDVFAFVDGLKDHVGSAGDLTKAHWLFDAIVTTIPHHKSDVQVWYLQNTYNILYDILAGREDLLAATLINGRALFHNANMVEDCEAIAGCLALIASYYLYHAPPAEAVEGPLPSSNIHAAMGRVEKAIHSFHAWSDHCQVPRPHSHAWAFLSGQLWQQPKRGVHFPEAPATGILFRNASHLSTQSGGSEEVPTEDEDETPTQELTPAKNGVGGGVPLQRHKSRTAFE